MKCNLSDNLNECPIAGCEGFLLVESCGMESDCSTLSVLMVCEKCNEEVLHKAAYDYSEIGKSSIYR